MPAEFRHAQVYWALANQIARCHNMLHIALYEPEIPPNTGNIIRLCANTGARLHLIHPLGFSLDEKRMRRAGLDYIDAQLYREHADFETFMTWLNGRRLLSLSTRSSRRYCEHAFGDEDVMLFGPETRGLPREVIESLPDESQLTLPMAPGSRSLNLSNTVAVVLYEAWRQLDFRPMSVQSGA